jgi:DNA uptake protein ComE-like DNA-binding protein
MRIRLSALALTAIIVVGLGCTANQKETPDQIRQKTAEATSEIKQDTKAVAQGIRDGLRPDKLIDLNRAGKNQIMTLPGISSPLADRIIAERPYKDPQQLVTRRILSPDQYDQVKGRVTVTQ